MIDEIEDICGTNELWATLLERNKFDVLFKILFMGIKESFFLRAGEIIFLNDLPPSFNSNDLIRKGELKELKAQFLGIISQAADLFELDNQKKSGDIYNGK